MAAVHGRLTHTENVAEVVGPERVSIVRRERPKLVRAEVVDRAHVDGLAIRHRRPKRALSIVHAKRLGERRFARLGGVVAAVVHVAAECRPDAHCTPAYACAAPIAIRAHDPARPAVGIILAERAARAIAEAGPFGTGSTALTAVARHGAPAHVPARAAVGRIGLKVDARVAAGSERGAAALHALGLAAGFARNTTRSAVPAIRDIRARVDACHSAHLLRIGTAGAAHSPAPPVVEPSRPAVMPGLVEPLAPAKPLLPPVPLARPPAPLRPTARQLPWSQTASAEHAVSHRPQLDGSNRVSVHTPSHNEMPGPHGAPFSGEGGSARHNLRGCLRQRRLPTFSA